MRVKSPKLLSIPLLLVLAARTGDPAPAQDDLFFDAVDVEIVNVEVVVTDAEDRPIRGLTAADFEVFEDGERVELTNFYAVERGADPVRQGDLEETAASPVEVAPAHTDRLQLVILVDDANSDPRNRRRVLAKLEEFLPASWRPEDRVMLARMDEAVEIVHPFTHDVEEILEALRGIGRKQGFGAVFNAEYQAYLNELERAVLARPPEPSAGGLDAVDPYGLNKQREFEAAVETARGLALKAVSLAERWQQRVVRSQQALTEFVGSLAGLPGRKAVVMVSDGLPVQSNSVTEAWVAKYQDWIFSFPGYTTYGVGQQDLQQDMTRLKSSRFYSNIDLDSLITEAGGNQVVFYPLSAARPEAGHVSAEYAGSGLETGKGPRSIAVSGLERMDRDASLLKLAAGTGGFAFTGTPNVDRLVDRLTRDFDDFYSLGYRLNRPVDDKLHRLKVEVRRQGAKVRHLKTYRQKDDVDRLEDLAISLLHYDGGSNVLGIHIEPGTPVKKGRNRYQVPIKVAIPFRSLLLLPEKDHHTGQLVMVVGALDDHGNSSPMRHVELPIRIPNDQLSQVLEGAAYYPLEMVMDGGRQLIAIAVRDKLAKVDATVRFELDVGGEADG